jgi:hypothetical protein
MPKKRRSRERSSLPMAVATEEVRTELRHVPSQDGSYKNVTPIAVQTEGPILIGSDGVTKPDKRGLQKLGIFPHSIERVLHDILLLASH